MGGQRAQGMGDREAAGVSRGGVTGTGGWREREEVQDGEDLASDGERKEEVVRPTLACGLGHGANGTPLTGRAACRLMCRVPSRGPRAVSCATFRLVGRVLPSRTRSRPGARWQSRLSPLDAPLCTGTWSAAVFRASRTNASPKADPCALRPPISSSRCSISFASATELPFQPAPLLRAPARPPSYGQPTRPPSSCK